MSRPRHSWKEIHKRKSDRYAKIGLDMEEKITSYLKKAVDENGQPIFSHVVHHEQHSLADQNDKDITVYRQINGITFKRSFGVTISLGRYHQTKNMHTCPVFYTPIGHNPENLIKKILDLF